MASESRQWMLWVPIAACALLVGVTTVIQGRMSERWATFPELDVFAKRVNGVPLDIGDWHGEEYAPLDPRVAAAAGSVGDIQRIYKNSAGEVVTVSLLCGRPKDMYHHTPDRCYKFQGYEAQGQIKEVSLPAGDTMAEFKMNDFFKSAPTGNDSQRVYWSFAADSKWRVPGDPALGFPGARVLYKIYVITPPGSEHTDEKNPATELIRDLIPKLNQALFANEESTELASN